MKLRRVLRPGMSAPIIQKQVATHWEDVSAQEALALSWLTPMGTTPVPTSWPASDNSGEQICLPCQPLSFRDGMLYEKHWVQSSRGYAARFLPWSKPFTRAFEALTGKPFPAFRPGKLWHKQPVYYFSNHLTMVPGGTTAAIPSYSEALDYELELGFVLSKPLFNATPQEALAAIGGFVVINDFSARDVQRAEMQTGLGPQKSKHFLSSMSPTLVTADEILPKLANLKAHVELNGQCMANTSTSGMKYTLGEVLAHLSKSEHLYPGELIATGTLPNGCGLEVGVLLKAGDHLKLTIDGVGDIVHTIA